jgi:hypothetical protein
MTAAPFTPEVLTRAPARRPAVVLPLHRLYRLAEIDRALEIASVHAAFIVAARESREGWRHRLDLPPPNDDEDPPDVRAANDWTALVIWTLEHERLVRELELPGPGPAASITERER